MGISNSVLPTIKNDQLRHSGRRRRASVRGLTPLEIPEVQVPSVWGVIGTAALFLPAVYFGLDIITRTIATLHTLSGMDTMVSMVFGLILLVIGIGAPAVKFRNRRWVLKALEDEKKHEEHSPAPAIAYIPQ